MTTEVVTIDATPLTQVYSILGAPISAESTISWGALIAFLVIVYLIASYQEKR